MEIDNQTRVLADYNIIVNETFITNVLSNNSSFFSYINEGTMKGILKKVNGLNVYYRGTLVTNINIGVYILAKEGDLIYEKVGYEIKLERLLKNKEKHKADILSLKRKIKRIDNKLKKFK